jgi:diaminopimelate decarboxylase
MYVYDGDMVRDRYRALKQALPSFDVFYSMKANPSFALVGFLRSLGAGAEIASGGELFLANEVGHDPLDIVFAGPGKTDRELEEAIVSGIFAVNVESLRELERLARIAKLVGVPARAALRVNTSVGLSKAGGGSAGPLHERMAGGPSKFGIDEEKLDDLNNYWDRRAVDIVGVHVYTASQILDADQIVENARRTASVAERVENLIGAPISAIDFGAGFGVPHYEEEEPLDLPALGQKIEDVFRPFSERDDMRLMIELGRYLVSECGVFVTRVIELKESRGERFVITDGGINQFVRPVLMKVRHEARVVSRLSSPTTTEAKVSGPLCTPIDITSERIEVPDDIALDDLIGIFNAGAYGFSMSPQLFLSHPSPVELLILDGEIIEARSRGAYQDLLSRQNPLPGTV